MFIQSVQIFFEDQMDYMKKVGICVAYYALYYRDVRWVVTEWVSEHNLKT